MRKMLILVLTMAVLTSMSATVSANWGSYYSSGENWSVSFHQDSEGERGLPFGWHERYENMRYHHHLERVYDWEWEHRFPGTHIYRWHDYHGFWHHGHFVTDALFFYNHDGELVSVGYFADGVFFHFRDDHECYQSRDSFYVSWWGR
jgi:hypothetical protein